MKRLTTRTSMDGKAKLIVADGTLSDKLIEQIAIQRLAEYEDAEEQGLLVRLPCKLGGAVYVIHKGDYKHNWKPYVNEKCVVEINHKCDRYGKDIEWELVLYSIINGTRTRHRISNVGKAVYLTREAAEKALEEVCRKNT